MAFLLRRRAKLALGLFVLVTLVANRNNEDPEYGYDCYPVGPCDACTAFELKSEAICQTTGNKEPIKCTPLDPPPAKSLGPPPAFRSCVMVKRLEKSRFFKFQASGRAAG
ncbi:hypothetical protein SYNPS1DRAFT_22051 [Syncephalis pseudoplumigaleata]|uniref:Uncharacterized protein n=1 Tax=Syncephalis pseudoplumigaleata TaxID=1712513 RepID=A0A4P9Z121_9FUNG|nr:hypothetical protein SYNPS1DRAFT_22051 [Syncephalis pseudoplumigaleata]|eukprot:RKP26114.1 hypothetical protein SYNPS1DRAFT_22051 [Syncephalis pseudoplumigaleata]